MPSSPSSSPRIAFCSTVKNRTIHLRETLPANLESNRDYANAIFVILNYGSQDDLLDYLVTDHKPAMKSGRIVVYTHVTDQPFHVSRAKNMAARCGILEGADILVSLDADNFTMPGFASFIESKFADEPYIYMCPKFVRSNPAKLARGYAGRLVIRSQDFIKIGGYNEKYDTWCGEDIELIARLRRGGYSERHIDNCYLDAVRHSADVRFKEWPHARRFENNTEVVKEINQSRDTVVSYGRIGCGVVYRNFDPTPIELAPVPTRVFGIGLHKTATTSLHRAFQILGYDSLHWGTGEAPKIWQEMNSDQCKSPTLEKFYAACDLPIPMLYEKLDRTYSRSKFILTIRNEDKWIRSVERLYDERYNPTRWEWEVYPFTNRIHTILYGRKDFDEATFRARYRRHNSECRDYFKYRPNDICIMDMDMDAGDGWPKLCNFLGVPVPVGVPYPTEYQTKLL